MPKFVDMPHRSMSSSPVRFASGLRRRMNVHSLSARRLLALFLSGIGRGRRMIWMMK